MSVHIYSGPTLTAAQARAVLPEAICHPPIRHGDLITLRPGLGDTVVILDGLFHTCPPIRHKEILSALADGALVIGASSLGALRAAELHPYGMIGIGRVFAAYRDGLLTADDAVTVQHTEDGRPLGEPLVNLAHTTDLAAERGLVNADQTDHVKALAARLHYSRRSWTAVRRIAAAQRPDLLASIDMITDAQACHPKAGDLKHADALLALRTVANGTLIAPDISTWATSPWQTSFLRHWATAYTTREVNGTAVPFRAELQHQQLYAPEFPARWRRRVLAWIAGPPAGADDVPARALDVAARRGITFEQLSPAQSAYWLTPAEQALDPDERMRLLLVRSARIDAAATIWPASRAEAHDLLPRDDTPATTVAAAWQLNRVIGRSAPNRSIHHLRDDLLRGHLAQQWGIAPDDHQGLTAAAFDRAFPSLDAAVEAVRPFYLNACGARRLLHSERQPSAA